MVNMDADIAHQPGRRVEIKRALVHLPHQQRAIGVAPDQQRGIDAVGRMNPRRERRARLAQRIDRADRKRAARNCARRDIEFADRGTHLRTTASGDTQPLGRILP